MVKNAVYIVNSKSIAANARKAALEDDRASPEAKQKEDDYCLEYKGAKSRAAIKRNQEAAYTVHRKSIAAKASKAALQTNRAALEAKQKEDNYWLEAEGAKSRAAKRREHEAEKKAETVAKKAEARHLAELEKKELEGRLWKVENVMWAEYVKEMEEAERIAKERKNASRVLKKSEYEMMVSVPNVNRDDSVIEARTVEDALADLTVVERHPKNKHKPSSKHKASRRMVAISSLLSDTKKSSTYFESFRIGV